MDFINILTFVLTAYHIKCQSVGIIMLYLLVQHVVVKAQLFPLKGTIPPICSSLHASYVHIHIG